MPLNRLQVSFLRTPAGHEEDVAVVTLHFRKPDNTLLDATQMAAVEARWNTFWTALHVLCAPYVLCNEFRWYDQQVWPTQSPLLRRQLAPGLAGTGTGVVLPPQCSCSMTLETGIRRRWGRFYLPGITSMVLQTGNGRILPATVDSMGTALHSFIAGCYMDGNRAVVYSPRGGKGPPAFSGGDALDVTEVRVDDIVDIVRSRRWQDSPYHNVQPIVTRSGEFRGPAEIADLNDAA